MKQIAVLEGHTSRIWHISWSLSQEIIASCSSDKTIRLWKKETSSKWINFQTIEDAHERTIRCVEFSPSSKQLCSCSFDSTIAIWEACNGERIEMECSSNLEGHENEVKSIGWSVSGSYLASCGRDKTVWIWEVIDGECECVAVLSEHSQDVKMVIWHPYEDTLASASYDNTIRIWKEDQDDWGHSSTVWSIDFDSTGNYLASVSEDKTIKIWGIKQQNSGLLNFSKTKPKWTCVSTFENLHQGPIYSVSWSKLNGMIATCSEDNDIKILQFDPENNIIAVVKTIENAHAGFDVNCVRWSPHEKSSNLLCSAGDDEKIRLFEINFNE